MTVCIRHIDFHFMCCLSLCIHATSVWVPTEARRRASDPLKPELQAVVSCQVWVLGTELGGSSARAPDALKDEPSLQPQEWRFKTLQVFK